MKRNVVALTAKREQQEADAASAVAAAFNDKRLTVAQAAEEAAVSVNTIRRAYESEHLKVIRFGIGGRGIRIRRGDLVAWLEAGGRTSR
jgi:excisionase family DNA binding protein